MEDTCEGKQSTFACLNDSLAEISAELGTITQGISSHLDRLVGADSVDEKVSEKPTPPQSLISELDDKVSMLRQRVQDLREQLNRVDGKF